MRVCRQCGIHNDDSYRFCHVCGAGLATSQRATKKAKKKEVSTGLIVLAVVLAVIVTTAAFLYFIYSVISNSEFSDGIPPRIGLECSLSEDGTKYVITIVEVCGSVSWDSMYAKVTKSDDMIASVTINVYDIDGTAGGVIGPSITCNFSGNVNCGEFFMFNYDSSLIDGKFILSIDEG
jgi:hypothetical protein